MRARLELTRVRPDDYETVAAELAAILVDAVADGASVGFVEPFELAAARTFWAGALRGEATITWVGRLDGRVVGVVQLKPSDKPNSAHRAEVAKLLVLRSARGQGVAAALMTALEDEARRIGRWLLMLDTRTGSPAEAMYQRWGWQIYGVVDEYAADPDGTLARCTFMTKRLTGSTG